jgi:subtilisin family serine protease
VRRARFLFLPFLFALAAAAPGASSPGFAPDAGLSAKFLPPRYRAADSATAERLEAWLRARPADSGLESRHGRTFRLSPGALRRLSREDGSGETSRARARRKLREIAGPGLVEDSVYAHQGYLPDDFSIQETPLWPLHNDGTVLNGVKGLDLGMDRVWERFDGNDSLVIAVLDAGINFLHPDLKDRWFVNRAEANGVAGVDDDKNGFVDDSTGWDFVDGDNRPQDYHGHGTMIAGQIAASFDNGAGIAGMLPRARILPVRVLGTTGSGYSGDIANGLRYAARMGATAVNFSIGISAAGIDSVIRNGFIALRDSAIPVAAASANEARNLDADPRSPSNYGFANVYNVASHSQSGTLSGFSNYGANAVDLAAPGEYIATSTVPPAIQFYRENFEDSIAQRWTFSGSQFMIGNDTLEGAKSLRWISGSAATATIDSVDLRGKGGGAVNFVITFSRARELAMPTRYVEDWVLVEAARYGTSVWTTVAVITSNVSKKELAFGLGGMDNRLFRLRFRTDFVSGGDNSTRVLRIDDVRIKHGDENPANQAQYTVTGGTSMAAPYVAGYAALMRLACKRMNVPFTRERMLAGVTPAPALAGKVKTGGRLDVAKGLDFYLRTLPGIAVNDSTKTAWPTGSQVSYTLSVRDSAGQSLPGWTFSAKDSTGGSLNGAAYAGPSGANGFHAVRIKAEKPPLVLRKRIRFQVNASGVALAASGRSAPLLRVGDRAFELPASAARGGARVLRVEFYGADGRTVRVAEGELLLPGGASEYRVEGFAAPGLRAWLDGAPLRAARP